MHHPLIRLRDVFRTDTGQNDPDRDYRREIVDLFRDYRHPWDILTELVQNSVDAINADTDAKTGSLKIEILPDVRQLRVKDDGVGIAKNDVQKVMVPNFSLKPNSRNTFGYKGVGLSFVSHLTEKFEIDTVHDGERVVCALSGSIGWAAERTGYDLPELSEPIVSAAPDEPSGTTITITLSDNYDDLGLRTLHSLEYFFEWAARPDVLEYVLRTRTAVGNTRVYLGREPKKQVEVVTRIKGEEREVPFEYLSPFEYTRKQRYFLQEPLGSQPPYEEILTDSQKDGAAKVFLALRHDAFDREVGKQERTRTPFDVSVIVCGETGVSELERQYGIHDLPGDYRSSFRMGTGVYMAVHGMPTSVQLSRWSDGFNKRFFCLVDVGMEANEELDKGRKGISEHTRNLLVNDIDSYLNERFIEDTKRNRSIRDAARWMMSQDTSGAGGTDVFKTVSLWDAQIGVLSELALEKPPALDENAVIYVFAELIGRRRLKGYTIKYISQSATFDMAFEYRVQEDYLDKHEYSISQSFLDKLSYDPFDDDGLVKGRMGQPIQVGEFKRAAEGIVSQELQPLQELDLLVCWDFDDAKVSRKGGTIRTAMPTERKFDGVTHVLSGGMSSGGDCQVICLKHLLLELGLYAEA